MPAERRPDPMVGVRPVQVVGLLVVVAGLPVSAFAMLSPALSQEQHALHTAVVPWLGYSDPDLRFEQQAIIASFDTERRLADHLDALGLPEGSVLMDTVQGFPIIASTKRPDRFVIPSDRDFVTILNDPAGHGVQFMLTVPNEGRGTSDALNLRYPTIHDNGAGIATLVMEVLNSGNDRPTWRLWRVNR